MAAAQKNPAPRAPAARGHRPCLELPENGRAELFGETCALYSAQSSPASRPGLAARLPARQNPEWRIRPQARLRNFLAPKGQGAPVLQMDGPGEIHALLSGACMNTGLAGAFAALYWRDLPLGFVVL